MAATQCLPPRSSTIPQWTSTAAKSLVPAPALGTTRFILCCCFLLMLLTFTPPWRPEFSTDMDFVAMLKMIARALVLGGMAILIGRGLSFPGRQAICSFLLPWFGFTAWGVASVLWSPLKSTSAGQVASFVILVMLATAVALTVAKAGWEPFIKGLVLQLLAVSILLLVIYFALPDWGSLSRARSGLLHATNGSATASLGLILLVSSWLLYHWNWTRRLLLPGLVIFSAVLLLAQNRTALAITVGVCGGLFALVTPPLWRALGLAAAGIGGVFYLVLDLEIGTTDLVLAELSTYLARGQTVQQMTELSGREEMWTVMWNSFLESPLLGHGYFVSSTKGELYVWYLWTNWTAHNFWLQVLVSTGVIGCLLMAWAIARYAFRLLRAVLRGDCEWQFGALIGTILVWQIGWGINNESFAGPLQPECVVYLVLLGITAGRIATIAIARTTNGTRQSVPHVTSSSPTPCAVRATQ